MPRGSKPKDYPVEQVAEVARLYRGGLTQSEIATAVNLTQKVVWRLMQRHGISARVAAKRHQTGEANTSWRGKHATYAAFHYRMVAQRGRPRRCEVCGTTDPERSYDWANLTGQYDAPDDYKRMCRSCHWQYDKKHLNFKGATGGRPARKEPTSCPRSDS